MKQVREQVVTAVMASAALAVFGYVVVAPQQQELQSLLTQERRLTAELASAEYDRDRSASLHERIRAGEREYRRIAEQVPADPDLGGLLEQLASAARTAGIRRESVRPGRTQQVVGIGVVPVEMSFEADFEALFRFVEALETMPRFVRVRAIDVSRMTPTSSTLQASLTLEAYFQAT